MKLCPLSEITTMIYRKSNFASELLLWLHKAKGEKQLGAAADTKIRLHTELPPLTGYLQ